MRSGPSTISGIVNGSTGAWITPAPGIVVVRTSAGNYTVYLPSVPGGWTATATLADSAGGTDQIEMALSAATTIIALVIRAPGVAFHDRNFSLTATRRGGA